MLGNEPFYFGTTRKIIIAFGTIFNNISIVRFDKNGNETQRFSVPLEYCNKEKYYRRITEDKTLQKPVEMSLPLMTYEITNIGYDSDRHINALIKNKIDSTDGNKLTQFAPVPYSLEFSLYIYARYQTDMFMCMEQIVPFFTPHFVLDVNSIPQLELTDSLPIVLNSVNTEDNFDGEFVDERRIITTMKFTAKALYYGPIRDSAVIKETFTNIFIPEGIDATDANPTNSNKVFTSELAVNPLSAGENDPHTIDETDTEYE